MIPARGGSKRIPRKNIRLFCGKPIIGYSIEAALQTDLFDQVIVSTDDDEIAEVARSFGASIPFMRPKTIADDFTGTNAVVKHAIEWLGENGRQVIHACCIYATAPLIQVQFVTRGFEMLSASNAAFAFSVTGYAFPIQRALRLQTDERVDALYPEHRMTRSQDLEPIYHDAGQFYWGTASAFLTELPLFAPHSLGVVLPRILVQDIDTPEDWEIAELMYRSMNEKPTAST